MVSRLVSPAGRTRLAGRVALVVPVVVMHACVVRHISQRMIDFESAAEMPARIELVYARELEPTVPPPVAAPAPKPAAKPPRRPERQAAPVAPAASAPVDEPPASSAEAVSAASPDVEPPVEVAAEPATAVPEEVTATPLEPDAAPSTPVAAADPAASAAEAFSWPPSTRITYELTGNYRGEVFGSAQVEWVRVGARYQVHLDVLVGPSFAPILSRRMTSEGQLTEDGLVPERYDEDSKALFRDRRRAKVILEPDAVVLNNGQRVERLPGVQDTASQFVQLAYLFSRHPELLKPGRTVQLPLALPRRMSIWTYDVRDTEVLYTPFGAIEAVPLKPRRESRKGDELSAQAWFAPSLRYLPVRIRIQQDTDTYIDLMIERRPQLAGP